MSPGRCLESMSLWPQASLQALRTIVPPLPKHWLLVCLYSHCVISFSLPRLVYAPQAVSSISQHRRAEHIVIVPFSMLAFAIYALCVVICDATMCVWCAGGALLGVAPRVALAQETRLSALALHMSLCLYCESVGDSWRFLVITRDSQRFLAIP